MLRTLPHVCLMLLGMQPRTLLQPNSIKRLVFHPHQPGDLVLLDDPAQRMNKLAPRWKGPFVVTQRMSRDGHPGVTYEVTDPRNARSRTWIVHHNRLKAKGPLSPAHVNSEAPSGQTDVGTSVTPAPSLNTLSGALPFRPPNPPHVTARARREALSAPGSTTPPSSAPTSPHHPNPFPSFPSLTACHRDGLTSSLQELPNVTSWSGHLVRRPLKYKDFVT